jgi:ribonuclease VapC
VVIDTSAILAILFDESEATRLIDAIDSDPVRAVGAPTLVEAGAVIVARKGSAGAVALDALMQRCDMTVEPISADAADFARSAYSRYGKGVGSPGVLNYGDCLSYGIAQALNQPLLFKGDDFSYTDVVVVKY